MAPEIHERKPYKGADVDLFAAGIVLFTIMSGHPPIRTATRDDDFYRLILANKINIFWKGHS